MKTQAIHKLLDLARRLPSIEILNSAEVTPLLEAARAIKAAEGELKAACAHQLEYEEYASRLHGGATLSERDRTPESAHHSLLLSF